VVLIVVEGGELVLVRQSRPGSGSRTLELPSGKLEDGEAPIDAAARELAEECGLAARELREIGTFWAAPGYSTELVYVFEAGGLSEAEPAALDDDEDIEVERLPLAGALGALDDAASIAALALWLDLQ
jgi:8-oxo-dGTP pyrophosphatase MutT (NUDIX family)